MKQPKAAPSLVLMRYPGIQEQLDALVGYLKEADAFCCIDMMLTARKKYSKPQ